MPALSRTASHTTPARPSISPLSSPAKTFKSSPTATRDSTTHDLEAQLNSEMGVEEDLADVDDAGSSSLSEPEDEDDDEDADGEDDDDDDANGVEEEEEEEVGDSTAQRALEVDSEAETERLDQTPKAARRRDEALGRTPSKLSQAATAEDDLSDPPSPLPAGVGAASSTSTVATVGQKRKRSEAAESPLTSAESDIGESPRKRSHEMAVDAPAEADEDAETITEPVTMTTEDTPVPDSTTTSISKKPGLGRKGKRKGAKKPPSPEPDLALPPTTALSPVPDSPPPTEPKTEEDLAAKTAATSIYESVARQFLSFRDRLTNERLATLTTELQLLSHPQPAHAEYLRQIAAVDARLQKQVREAHAYYNHRLRSLRDRTLGERSQLHSQFYQHVREVREEVLERLGGDWYGIQSARRSGAEDVGEDGRYLYMFPRDKTERVKVQARWNQEVSVLSGVARYVGFPAAPALEGAGDEGVEGDLRAMKLPPPSNKRPLQPSTTTTTAHPAPTPAAPPLHPHRPIYLSATSTPAPTTFHHSTHADHAENERLAHDQFIEQNAWARPPSMLSTPVHHHGAREQGLLHGGGVGGGLAAGLGVGGVGVEYTDDWRKGTAELVSGGVGGARPLGIIDAGRDNGAVSARNLLRDLSGRVFRESIGGGVSPAGVGGSMAPLQQQHDPSSSPLLGTASGGVVGGTKTRLDRHDDAGGASAGGYRNFSNLSGISGVSTIDAPLPADGEKRRYDEHDKGRKHEEAEEEDEEGPRHPLPRFSAASAPGHAFVDGGRIEGGGYAG